MRTGADNPPPENLPVNLSPRDEVNQMLLEIVQDKVGLLRGGGKSTAALLSSMTESMKASISDEAQAIVTRTYAGMDAEKLNKLLAAAGGDERNAGKVLGQMLMGVLAQPELFGRWVDAAMRDPIKASDSAARFLPKTPEVEINNNAMAFIQVMAPMDPASWLDKSRPILGTESPAKVIDVKPITLEALGG